MKNETCLIKKAEGENLMIREEKDKCSEMEEMKRNGRDCLQTTQAEAGALDMKLSLQEEKSKM